MQWPMMQQATPEDFVIATGVQVSVREFVGRAAAQLGTSVQFSGSGFDEIGTIAGVQGNKTQCMVCDVLVRVDAWYFRPVEVETLQGDTSKARVKLGWTPVISLGELVREIIAADHAATQRDTLIERAGFPSYSYHEGHRRQVRPTRRLHHDE